jgi:hypothetical protein
MRRYGHPQPKENPMRTKKARVGKRRRSGAATKARLAGNEKGRRASTAQVQQRLKGNPTAASRMPKATKARAAKRMSVLDAASAGKLMRAEGPVDEPRQQDAGGNSLRRYRRIADPGS